MLKRIAVIFILFSLSVSYAEVPYTVSWTPPTTNADVSPLTDLAGFFVYCDDQPKIDVPNPAATSFVMNRECNVSYVTAYDTSGNESAASNTIDAMPPFACTGYTK